MKPPLQWKKWFLKEYLERIGRYSWIFHFFHPLSSLAARTLSLEPRASCTVIWGGFPAHGSCRPRARPRISEHRSGRNTRSDMKYKSFHDTNWYIMTQDSASSTLLMQKCKEAHLLVNSFLDDTLSQAHLAKLDPPYIVRPQRRQIVKEKVKKSLEVLDSALDSLRYVSKL